ncbi:hypothetical protein KP509_22G053500 [Ceratopteris richardii]|nr:hypothetical protein KP509_22G053500 [Ceratopteris richardii]
MSTPKDNLATKSGVASANHPLATPRGRSSQCKTWLACKQWLRKQRRSLVWVFLAFSIALSAMIWYHQFKHAQEMAKKKTKRWWFF